MGKMARYHLSPPTSIRASRHPGLVAGQHKKPSRWPRRRCSSHPHHSETGNGETPPLSAGGEQKTPPGVWKTILIPLLPLCLRDIWRGPVHLARSCACGTCKPLLAQMRHDYSLACTRMLPVSGLYEYLGSSNIKHGDDTKLRAGADTGRVLAARVPRETQAQASTIAARRRANWGPAVGPLAGRNKPRRVLRTCLFGAEVLRAGETGGKGRMAKSFAMVVERRWRGGACMKQVFEAILARREKREEEDVEG
ncbi:hypothetical protein V8C26DRAFT_386801 [Trichoderma gracile]